ncbi:serine/threonine-protein kinase dst2-like isoform X2 [Dreissena polymorpha]|uniref:serine/threonine-protein kinase dst2-like isoform X2 n=1 Tax=Dreissena polymorpha TaxID=45954 RepID=UPI002263E999|nr:serine/threonine-protein kinase dst2-like isoform X2 [Dreissena polymorpha]
MSMSLNNWKSAFHSPNRGGETKHVEAPAFRLAPYAGGGLYRLYHLIKIDTVPDLPEYGIHTNAAGHFTPQSSCIMGLRYKVKKILDSNGQSSVVVLAQDLFRGGENVVVKVLHSKFYALGFQESSVLQRLARMDPLNHSQTLRLLATLTFDSHYCLVFEPLLAMPLTSLFQDRPQSQRLQDIRRVGLRLLCSLGFLHQQNLIHTDLKPDNILLKHARDVDSVHIVDFGNTLHCVHSEMSLYYKDFELQTPLYRAPEVMFGLPFGPEIDMWSLGCILAELYIGHPIFLGTSKHEILTQIVKLLGPLPSQVFRRGKYFHTYEQFTEDTNGQNATLRLHEHLNCGDLSFANLLAGLLAYRPGTKDQSRSTFLTDVYQYKPKVSPDIKRRQPTSMDLLKMGTSELPPLDQVTIIKPSPVKGKVPNQSHESNYSACQGEEKAAISDLSMLRNVSKGIEHGKFSDNIKNKMSKLLEEIKKEQNWAEVDLDRKHAHGRLNMLTEFATNVERPCAKYGIVVTKGRSFEDKGTQFTCSAREDKKLLFTENLEERKMVTQVDTEASEAHRSKETDDGIARGNIVQNKNGIGRKRTAKESIDVDNDSEYIDLLSPPMGKEGKQQMPSDCGSIERKRHMYGSHSGKKRTNYPATTAGHKPRQLQEMRTECSGSQNDENCIQERRNLSSGFQSTEANPVVSGENVDNYSRKRTHHKQNNETVSSGVFRRRESKAALFEGISQNVLPTPIKPVKYMKPYSLESPEIIYKRPLTDKKEAPINQNDSGFKNITSSVDSIGLKSSINRYSSENSSYSSDSARASLNTASNTGRRKSRPLSGGEDNTEVRSLSTRLHSQGGSPGLPSRISENMWSGINCKNVQNSAAKFERINPDWFAFHGTPASEAKSLNLGIAQRIEKMRVKKRKEAKRSLSFQKTAKQRKDHETSVEGSYERRIEKPKLDDEHNIYKRRLDNHSIDKYRMESFSGSDSDVSHSDEEYFIDRQYAQKCLQDNVRDKNSTECKQQGAKVPRQRKNQHRTSTKPYERSLSQDQFTSDKNINNTYVIDFESPRRN